MIWSLLFLISTIYNYSSSSIEVTLNAGVYYFECWGAQGGTGCSDGKYTSGGGNGAYVSGLLQVTKETNFYLFVGGKGGYASCKPNSEAPGGWNGGGKGGKDTTDNDSSGGGGGATDIRLLNGQPDNMTSLLSRIMVAAGGSGSTWNCYGAPGGTLEGYEKINTEQFGVQIVSTTSQTTGFALGKGADGQSHTATPSSGAGGGFYGGASRPGYSGNVAKAVSESGSSYISGHPSCNSISQSGTHTGSPNHFSGLVFYNTTMISGIGLAPSPANSDYIVGNSGDGAIRITFVRNLATKIQNIKTISLSNLIFFHIIFLCLAQM